MSADRNLRKQPRQERSRAMVDKIISAAWRVLSTGGHERATTNRVAAEAGISPGSLYQYFPNKEAILAAVVDRYSVEISEELAALVVSPRGREIEDVLREIFTGLLTVIERHKEYVRLVVESLPVAATRERTADLERRIGDLVGAYLTILAPHSHVPASTSAWILVRMVEHLSVRYVLEAPPIPREQMVEELVRLAVAHLNR